MSTMSAVESQFCRSAPWRAFARSTLPWAVSGVQLQGDVLEIGCGSGAMADALLRAHPAVRLTATDFDATMVRTARRALRPFGDRASVTWADATQLACADATFDGVVTFLMLHHTVEWEQVIREAVRVLRPGGRLIGFDLLGSWPARTVHRLEGAPHRFVEPAALGDLLGELPVIVDVFETVPQVVVRFIATRV